MNYLVMVEMLDSEGKIDRVDTMTVIGDLARAELFRETAHEFYEDRGYAVCVKIYSEQDILKAFGRI